MRIACALFAVIVPVLTTAGTASAQDHAGAHEATATTTTAVFPDASCPKIANFTCFGYEYGWVLTQDTTAILQLINDIRGVAHIFETSIGSKLARGAVVLITDGTPTMKDALTKAGASWIFSFQSRAGLRQTMVRQLLASHMADSSAMQGLIAGQMEQYDETIQHELGHKWLACVWSAHGLSTEAPDWLNEGVATLLEGPSLMNQRKAVLRSAYPEHSFIPLDTLFFMQNPVESQGGQGISSRAASRGFLFYAECYGVLQLLLEHSKSDQPIVWSIALSLGKGDTMAKWLQANGARYGLPSTVAGLDATWQQWLRTSI